ncbi:MAG: DUF882 domain-containing protein [Deltaproteobacteria bacterium]|nr:DUF882 domain-containing protein [Deltaproteobacteria bacterium]
MFKIRFICVIFLVVLISGAAQGFSIKQSRFFYAGDGVLVLDRKIRFRDVQGNYLEPGLKEIHRAFGAPWALPYERLSLRFIEMLDYLQEQFNHGAFSIRSGYRSPNANQSLRKKGKLAAMSSMHIEGAAADLYLQGASSQKIFATVRDWQCCGIGYYGSQHFHLDTGPARWWDQNTSKTESQAPQENEKIIIQTTQDIYFLGEKIDLQFMRVTNYPIDVNKTVTVESKNKSLKLDLRSDMTNLNACMTLKNRSEGRQLSIHLPEKKLEAGRYQIKITFCNKRDYAKMPGEIVSNVFEVGR